MRTGTPLAHARLMALGRPSSHFGASLFVTATALGLTLACSHQGRVPQRHRPSAVACPQQRAAETPEASTSCPMQDAGSGPICECNTDSDCKAGLNGRCGNSGGGPAGTFCSYDQCFSDSQCNAGTVCMCRASSASDAPNYCSPSGNCVVDSDCGPGGFCSPSGMLPGGGSCSCFGPETSPPTDCGSSGTCSANGKVVPCVCSNTCGQGYFCHTPDDACVDDSDCTGGTTCNYDLFSGHWVCAPCAGPV